MIKTALALSLIVFIQLTYADGSKTVESKIEKVTVYLDGAQVTRTAQTNIATGKTEVKFGNLSPYIDKSSILVSTKGGITVASVVTQANKLTEQKKKDEVTQLEKRREEFNKKLEDENNIKEVYDEGIEILKKNQLVNSQHTDLKIVDLKAAMDFHQERLAALKKTMLVSERVIKKLNDTIAVIDAQLQTLNAKQDPSTSDLIVTVNAKQTTEASFNISYFVNYAGWFPTYDFRVDDISKPINVSYRANVHQNTGEDWKDIKLTLSNAEPKTSGVIPNLRTWYLSQNTGYTKTNFNYTNAYPGRTPDPGVMEVKGRVYDDYNKPLFGATIIVKGTTIGTTSDYDGNYSIKLPPGPNYLTVSYIGYTTQDIPAFSKHINIKMTQFSNNLDEVAVGNANTNAMYFSARTGGAEQAKEKIAYIEPMVNIETNETFSPTTYSFEIQMPYSIPNDGKTYAVDIKQQDISATYVYKCTPKLDKEAFLMANITDWNDYNFLDGEANLYFEGTYLGKTLLNTAVENDTIEISLGHDKGVTVTRTKLKDEGKKTFFGDKKITSRAFEITVRNNKKQPINILVLDQFPVSTQKEIEVDKQEYNEASLDNASGKLTWDLQIPTANEKKIGFKYAVKYPKDYHVLLE